MLEILFIQNLMTGFNHEVDNSIFIITFNTLPLLEFTP